MMMPDGKTPSEGFACLNTEEFGKHFGAIAKPEFITRLIKEDLTPTVNWLKEVQGCTKVGFVGFSYGGMIGEQVSLLGLSDATVSISGVHMSGGDHEPAHRHFLAIQEAGKCPMFYIRAQGETFFTDEAEKGFRNAGAKVESFGEGMYHDFVLRGDFSEGSKTKELADKAMEMTCEHLIAAFVPDFFSHSAGELSIRPL
jgi:dienelactone hydrolase